MPVYEVIKSGKKRKRLNPCGLISILKNTHIDHAFVEEVNAMPKNGITAAFTFGWMCAGLETALVACEVPFTYVRPQEWKKAMKCPRDKDESRMRATQLMPSNAELWRLKKHDGRAEAAMIGLYGEKITKGEITL